MGEQARKEMAGKHAAREHALQLCREAVRHSANAIRAAHRLETGEAQGMLQQARESLEQAGAALQTHLDIYHAGFLHDAQKEYAEASITLAFITSAPLPQPSELRVELPAYLNGMGEAVGELRRHILDSLRRDQVSRCEELLGIMDEVYGLLVTMDYPDAITGGLRRTTDMVRGVVERTRGDLTLAQRQHQLEACLEAFQQHLQE